MDELVRPGGEALLGRLRSSRTGTQQGSHLLTVGPVQPRRLAPRQPTHQGELAPVMDAVRDDHAPQDVPNRQRAREERNRTIKILRLQLADPRHGFPMNPLVSWGKGLDRARALNS